MLLQIFIKALIILVLSRGLLVLPKKGYRLEKNIITISMIIASIISF